MAILRCERPAQAGECSPVVLMAPNGLRLQAADAYDEAMPVVTQSTH